MQEQCQRIGEAEGKIYPASGKGGRTIEMLVKETHLNNATLFNRSIVPVMYFSASASFIAGALLRAVAVAMLKRNEQSR